MSKHINAAVTLDQPENDTQMRKAYKVVFGKQKKSAKRNVKNALRLLIREKE